MNVDREQFAEILDKCFKKALAFTGDGIRRYYLWIKFKGNYSLPDNWALTMVNSCWHRVLKCYSEQSTRRFPEKQVRGAYRTLENCRLASTTLDDMPDLVMDGRCVLDLLLGHSRLRKDSAPGELPELLSLFDKAAPDLLRRADEAVEEMFRDARSLHARYSIARTSIEAFAQQKGLQSTIYFDHARETFRITLENDARNVRLRFEKVPIDEVGSLLEKLPILLGEGN